MAKLPKRVAFKIQKYKSNADPNNPPGYDDCLSVIDMRPHRRKDKSRAPGKMFPPTPSLPIEPENRPGGQFNFGPGAGPQMNPAYGNMFITPPIHFQTAIYQQSQLSPKAHDVEVIRRANILLDAVKVVWGDSSSEADSSDEEEASENAHPPINATQTVLPSVEGNQLDISSSPHVPVYLAPQAAARPPRQGHIIKFDNNKGLAKLPTPPSEPSPIQAPSILELPPRQGPATRLPDQPAARPNTNPGPAKAIPGVPQYLPPQYPVLASKPPTSRNFSLHPPPPMAFPPPVMSGFKPINGNAATYLPANHTQQPYSFTPPMADPRNRRHSQSPALPMNSHTINSLPPAMPNIGTNGSTVPKTAPSQHQAPPIPPKNGTVVRLNDPGPAKEHPRQKPPKNGTLIDFGKPAKSGSRKRKA
ncbi:hypothetical protein EG327_001206 [Venturia inaequalis]|uniref:Uncharacterized protein n=1 Tax=Venturia inaequalis TaxID=5025 RepID=A0A8H3ZCL6_VENIN|nr:hypothetical protein EG327_001206 [Venturia inaequalis]